MPKSPISLPKDDDIFDEVRALHIAGQDLPPDVVLEEAGGQAPYQVSGTLRGGALRFYFRSRSARWSLSIDPHDPLNNTPLWRYTQAYPGGPFDASFITSQEANAFLQTGFALFNASLQSIPYPLSR